VKSKYHPNVIQSLEKRNKTPSSHMKERITTFYKGYDTSLETLMDALRKMHIGIKSNLGMADEQGVVMIYLVDEDNNNNNNSVLDTNAESHIKHYAWANDLRATEQVNTFIRAKKKDLTNSINININANSTP